MKHIFLDTNVVIDFLSDRQPFSIDAEKLFDLADNAKIRIYISAVSYNNIYYILRQGLSNNNTIKLLEELTEIVEIVDVTSDVIIKSLKSEFKDYEDAIKYNCALNVPGIDFIVTRNTKDFKNSTIAILTPNEAIAALNTI